MSWSYSGDPSSSTLDEVRFYLGDTVSADPLLQNEEIQFLLNQSPNKPLVVAHNCANAIAARFARLMDKSVGDLRVSYTQRYRQYKELAQSLANQANATAAAPYCGGISQSDKDNNDADTDLMKRNFKIGMTDFQTSDVDDNDQGQ